ncbi:MAG: aminotransferase class I/II-fold pyridoxal phosphate-dependent enzyme [Bacteroidetes bacterium]|nr:aminotransferase class I/II-fold pyridoxal phosphate-dependent enzyme [Bacteroidota bacterium]MBS1541548.1 aminotransferase class I/II-fold pyridoxal phosphate-dependent enzyme [Bacteroidota bacterium]
MLDDILHKKLEHRKQEGLFRSLVISRDKIDFASNDYLGFARSSFLETNHTPDRFGATGSRLISGNCIEAEEAEQAIAQFHQTEAALIFNSGYAANTSLACLASKNDTFIADELIHASMIDGIRMSVAAKLKFKHNNADDLAIKLKKATGSKIVLIESLYSMDGDEAPLAAMAEVCRKHHAHLIVDEAHAIGVFGKKGEGLVGHLHLQDQVYACVYTFGKALGLHGAAVAGSATLKNYLINFARPFIYSTALPPLAYRHIQTAYEHLPTANRNQLFDLIQYFKDATTSVRKFSFLKSDSPIQGLLVSGNDQAKRLSSYLFENGIYAKAILSPSVPAGTERLRICLHTFNTREQIDLLMQHINHFAK